MRSEQISMKFDTDGLHRIKWRELILNDNVAI